MGGNQSASARQHEDGTAPDRQAGRRERFTAAHPHVHVAAKRAGEPWQAYWLDPEAMPRHFSHPDEDGFYDLLEARFPVPDSS